MHILIIHVSLFVCNEIRSPCLKWFIPPKEHPCVLQHAQEFLSTFIYRIAINKNQYTLCNRSGVGAYYINRVHPSLTGLRRKQGCGSGASPPKQSVTDLPIRKISDLDPIKIFRFELHIKSTFPLAFIFKEKRLMCESDPDSSCFIGSNIKVFFVLTG